jgi:hypothetical protein
MHVLNAVVAILGLGAIVTMLVFVSRDPRGGTKSERDE